MGILDKIESYLESNLIAGEIIETDNYITVNLKLPNVKKEDIELHSTNKELIVKAKQGTVNLSRKIVFPEKVNLKSANSTLKDDVLKIKFHKENFDNRQKKLGLEIKEFNTFSEPKKNHTTSEGYLHLINSLGSSNSHIRDKAVNNLVNIGEPALESVIRATKNDDSVIRQKACDVLGLMGDLRAVNPLCNLLKDSNKYVRRRAANAIILIHDERFVIPLINALDDSDFKVRVLAANALGIIGDQRAVEPLTKIKTMPISEFKHLLSGNFNERMLIAAAKFSLEKLEIRREEDLKKQMQKHENSLLTFKNLYENHENEEAKKFIKEHLIKDLESSYEEIQDDTAIFLSHIGYMAVEPLIEALKSPNEDVRGYAAAILGNISDLRAVDPLIETLEGPNDCIVRPHANNPEWNVKALAAAALGDIGDEKAIIPLKNRLNDDDYVRGSAEKALRKFGKEGIEAIETYKEEVKIREKERRRLEEIKRRNDELKMKEEKERIEKERIEKEFMKEMKDRRKSKVKDMIEKEFGPENEWKPKHGHSKKRTNEFLQECTELLRITSINNQRNNTLRMEIFQHIKKNYEIDDPMLWEKSFITVDIDEIIGWSNVIIEIADNLYPPRHSSKRIVKIAKNNRKRAQLSKLSTDKLITAIFLLHDGNFEEANKQIQDSTDLFMESTYVFDELSKYLN